MGDNKIINRNRQFKKLIEILQTKYRPLSESEIKHGEAK